MNAPVSVRHIPSLDGLRAVSFLLVFVAHAGLKDVVPGGFGVTVFFFLSGFLITTLMRMEQERTGAVNFKHFWLRRALRILPPFYVVLVLACAVALLLDPPGQLEFGAVAAQALHYSNYWLIHAGYGGQALGTPVYWSLAVEEHFYLLFPWLYVLMWRARMPGAHQAFLLWGLCALVLLWRCVLVFGFDVSADRTYLASDTRVDSILFGCALAVWRNPVLDVKEVREGREDRALLWVWLPVALAVLVGCLVYRNGYFRETLRYSLQGAALTVIFVAAIRYAHWGPFRLLNTRVMVFIGTLSYSLYLVHYVVLLEFERHLPQIGAIMRALLSFALSLVLAWAIYLLVERPSARVRAKFKD